MVNAIQESVPIEDIVIPKGRRRVNGDKVKSLCQSIKAIGLLQPVGITPDYLLIFGMHRIEAFKLLGLKTIDCRIIEASELETQLAEIDENVERTALDALEWSQTLKRRKEIYEALHPETTHGGDRIKSQNPRLEKEPRFTADTAAKTGVSERVIQEDVKLAEDLSEPLQEAIAETDPKASKSDLKAAAALPEKQQETVAKKLKSGKAKTVKAALPKQTRPSKNGAETGSPALKRELFKDLGKVQRGLDKLKIYASCKTAVEYIHKAIKEA